MPPPLRRLHQLKEKKQHLLKVKLLQLRVKLLLLRVKQLQQLEETQLLPLLLLPPLPHLLPKEMPLKLMLLSKLKVRYPQKLTQPHLLKQLPLPKLIQKLLLMPLHLP